MTETTDILIRILLDKAAQAQTQKGAKGLTEDFNKLNKSLSGKELTDQLERVVNQLNKVEQETKETIAGLKAEARVLSATASAMVDGAEKATLGFTKTLAGQLEGISKLSLATGTALVGGILGFANKYIANAKVATETTRAWKAEQDDLNRSGERIGAVLAKEALPLLKEVSELAKDVSNFVETHPEAVRAALETGKVLIGLGAIGLLVSKGVKLVADIKYLATIPVQLEAARLQDRAASKQLEAAALRAGIPVPGGGGGGAAGAGGLLAGVASPLGIATLALAAAVASNKAADGLIELEGAIQKFGDSTGKSTELLKIGLLGITAAYNGVSGLPVAIKNLKQALARDIPLIAGLLGLGGGSVGGPGATGGRGGAHAGAGGLTASPQFDRVLKAYEQYKQDDLAAVQKHYDDRKKIMADALASEQKANAQYAASVAKVRSQTTSALSSAAKDLQAANEKAEIDFQTTRAQIVRDGNQEIEQLNRDLQEQLLKIEKEHEERQAGFIASRDALGLSREDDRFKNEQADAKREASLEIRQRRQDIAQRLSDLQQSYEQERAQRFADYQARTAEIRAQADAQLTELRIQHAAELREIQQNKVSRIKELDSQYTEERKRRYQQLVQNIRDLDASLLGESNLKKQYYAAMEKDLDGFLASYKAKLGSLAGALPGKSAGGYSVGPVKTGEKGYEYIMTNATTRAAEKMIGGRLTQDSLLNALMGQQGRGGASVVWNDQRRFDGAYTNEIRRANRDDTMSLIEGLFGR